MALARSKEFWPIGARIERSLLQMGMPVVDLRVQLDATGRVCSFFIEPVPGACVASAELAASLAGLGDVAFPPQATRAASSMDLPSPFAPLLHRLPGLYRAMRKLVERIHQQHCRTPQVLESANEDWCDGYHRCAAALLQSPELEAVAAQLYSITPHLPAIAPLFDRTPASSPTPAMEASIGGGGRS